MVIVKIYLKAMTNVLKYRIYILTLISLVIISSNKQTSSGPNFTTVKRFNFACKSLFRPKASFTISLQDN